MSADEFLFALQLTDFADFDDMLRDLIVNVMDHLGYAGEAVSDVLAEVGGAFAGLQACARCDLRFHAQRGTLQIVVTHGGGREWQTTRPLP